MLHHLLQCAVAWGAKAAPPQQPPPPTLPDSLIDSVLFKLLLFNVGMVTLLKLYSLSTGMRPGSYQAPAPSDIVSYSPGEQMFVTDPKGEAVVRVAKTGVASLEPSTVPKVFKMAAANFPDAPALMVERNGAWLQWSWCQYYNESCAMAKSLLALGFAPHDSVNVIGFNSPEWVIAQMAANLAGGKAAGVYTTNEPAACRYIAEHSEAVVIFVEDEKQVSGSRDRTEDSCSAQLGPPPLPFALLLTLSPRHRVWFASPLASSPSMPPTSCPRQACPSSRRSSCGRVRCPRTSPRARACA